MIKYINSSLLFIGLLLLFEVYPKQFQESVPGFFHDSIERESSNSISNTNSQNQFSKEKLLCEKWRKFEGINPGSDVDDGWKRKVTRYINDTSQIVLITYYPDNTFVSYSKLKNTNGVKVSIVDCTGTWSFNQDSTELEEKTLLVNGQSITPIVFNHDILILTNDTLRLGFRTRSGWIIGTFIPERN